MLDPPRHLRVSLCPWSVQTSGLVSGAEFSCLSVGPNGGEQRCDFDGKTGAFFVAEDVASIVEYYKQLGGKSFFVRDHEGNISEVDPYPNEVADNTNEDADGTVSELLETEAANQAGGPALPRCENTDETPGNEDWWITKTGSHCATILYSSSYRSIDGGGHLTYSAEVTNADTCESVYEWKMNWGTVREGTCKSYYLSDGIACLSSCHDKYDCYVSQNVVALRGASCSELVAAEGETTANESADDGGNGTEEGDGNLCYNYKYSKGPFKEAPPEQRECDSSCVSYESTRGVDATISIGRCNSGIDNFCVEMNDDGAMTKCVECNGDLCNPVYSYNGGYGRALHFSVGVLFAASAVVNSSYIY